MFSTLNTELKCALLAGCVFVFFFALSMTSVAGAATFQWDDGTDGHYSEAPEDSAAALHTNDTIMGVSRGNDYPLAAGPNDDPGSSICDSPSDDSSSSVFGWWQRIMSFFTALLSSFAK